MIDKLNGYNGYTSQNGGRIVAYHTSTKMSPFEALYGYPPPTTREYVINNFKFPASRYYLATSDEVIHILKNHLKQERNHMKQQADSKRYD